MWDMGTNDYNERQREKSVYSIQRENFAVLTGLNIEKSELALMEACM